MSGSTFEAHPIPIVINEEEHLFSLNEEALEKVLLQDHIKDCNAVVVSVAGAYRKGKSFILDFFLRYMNYMVRYTYPSKLPGRSHSKSRPIQKKILLATYKVVKLVRK